MAFRNETQMTFHKNEFEAFIIIYQAGLHDEYELRFLTRYAESCVGFILRDIHIGAKVVKSILLQNYCRLNDFSHMSCNIKMRWIS